MKLKTIDTTEQELVSVGQNTNRTSLRKEASIETDGHTKIEEKRIAKAIRERKNANKGKVSTHTQEKSLKKTPKQKSISKRARERKENNKVFEDELESFSLEETETNQVFKNENKNSNLKENVSEKEAKDIDKFAKKTWSRTK